MRIFGTIGLRKFVRYLFDERDVGTLGRNRTFVVSLVVSFVVIIIVIESRETEIRRHNRSRKSREEKIDRRARLRVTMGEWERDEIPTDMSAGRLSVADKAQGLSVLNTET